jgi:hypothetical protein
VSIASYLSPNEPEINSMHKFQWPFQTLSNESFSFHSTQKCVSNRGFARDPAGGAHNAPLAGLPVAYWGFTPDHAWRAKADPRITFPAACRLWSSQIFTPSLHPAYFIAKFYSSTGNSKSHIYCHLTEIIMIYSWLRQSFVYKRALIETADL